MIGFQEITVKLVGSAQIDRVKAIVENLPVGNGIECVFRTEKKIRKPSANSLMWAGPLKDISEQAWVSGRQFSAEVWHEHAKVEFLPEDDDPELSLLVSDHEKWKKWDFLPNGDRICVGSTTKLTKLGMSRHIQKLEALGANLGVQFFDGRWHDA